MEAYYVEYAAQKTKKIAEAKIKEETKKRRFAEEEEKKK